MIESQNSIMTDRFIREGVSSQITDNAAQYLDRIGYSLPRMGHFMVQDGRIRVVCEQFAEILGNKDPEHYIGKPFLDLLHPADRDRFNLDDSLAALEKLDDTSILRMFAEDGQTLEVSVQGIVPQSNGGAAFEGFLIDLTTASAVRKSMKRYWKLINHIEDVVVEVDLNGNITYFNAAAVKYWGAHCRRGEPRRLTNYREYIKERDLAYVRKTYLDVYHSGQPKKNVQYEITTQEGRRRFVDDSVTPIRDDTGRIVGFRTVSRNLTNLKQIEQKTAEHRSHLEAIFRSVKDAIITVAPDKRVLNANASAKAICGIDINKSIDGLFNECMTQCNRSCTQALEQTLKRKKTIREFRVACGVRHNRRQTVSVSSTPLLDRQGGFMGAVLVMRDVTRLVNLELEMRERHHQRNIIGQSKKMQEVLKLVEGLADLETTVLISGESGTGKELIARALHLGGQRRAKPFVSVNCSALAENLLESELFGHVKGAFTGAVQDKMGRFQCADGGTILLDEISDIPPLIQLKLLRVIQEKTFERVGEANSRKVDVRIVACTNKDLKQQVLRGKFREDLYYRLKVIQIDLPPLRQRIEDVPLLTQYFCQLFNRRFNRTIEDITDDAMDLLTSYHWPGNVRELEHIIERAFVLCHGRIIAAAHLPSEIRQLPLPDQIIAEGSIPRNQTARQILNALNNSLWNKSKAAGLLGISRQTLYRKIKEYDLIDKV